MSRFPPPPPPPPRFQRRPEIDERKYSWKGRIVFLSNIPYCYKAQDLLVIMRQFGRVFRCDLSRAENGKSKGFAFIEFEKVESAKLAVEYMDTATLLNKNLRCEISEFPPDELVEIYKKTAKERMMIDSGQVLPPPKFQKEKDSSRKRKDENPEYSDSSDSGYSDSYSYSDYSDYSSSSYSSTYSSDSEDDRKKSRSRKDRKKEKKEKSEKKDKKREKK